MQVQKRKREECEVCVRGTTMAMQQKRGGDEWWKVERGEEEAEKWRSVVPVCARVCVWSSLVSPLMM